MYLPMLIGLDIDIDRHLFTTKTHTHIYYTTIKVTKKTILHLHKSVRSVSVCYSSKRVSAQRMPDY